MKLHLSSDEVNILVHRYLLENGFVHTAFVFHSEASMGKNPFWVSHSDKLPPNALISFLQKAILFIYIEYHTDDATGEEIKCDEPFSFFRRHECWFRGADRDADEVDEDVSRVTSRLSIRPVNMNLSMDSSSSTRSHFCSAVSPSLNQCAVATTAAAAVSNIVSRLNPQSFMSSCSSGRGNPLNVVNSNGSNDGPSSHSGSVRAGKRPGATKGSRGRKRMRPLLSSPSISSHPSITINCDSKRGEGSLEKAGGRGGGADDDDEEDDEEDDENDKCNRNKGSCEGIPEDGLGGSNDHTVHDDGSMSTKQSEQAKPNFDCSIAGACRSTRAEAGPCVLYKLAFPGLKNRVPLKRYARLLEHTEQRSGGALCEWSPHAPRLVVVNFAIGGPRLYRMPKHIDTSVSVSSFKELPGPPWPSSSVELSHLSSLCSPASFTPGCNAGSSAHWKLDGSMLATGYESGHICLWTPDGALLGTLKLMNPAGADSSSSNAPSQKNSGSSNNSSLLSPSSSSISCIAFSPSGKYLAAAAAEGVVRIWRVEEEGVEILCSSNENNGSNNGNSSGVSDGSLSKSTSVKSSGKEGKKNSSNCNNIGSNTSGAGEISEKEEKDDEQAAAGGAPACNNSADGYGSQPLLVRKLVRHRKRGKPYPTGVRIHDYAVYRHSGSVIDIDWQGDNLLASGAIDGSILIHDIESRTETRLSTSASSPVEKIISASSTTSSPLPEVAVLRWDAHGDMLAVVDSSNNVVVWRRRRHTQPVGGACVIESSLDGSSKGLSNGCPAKSSKPDGSEPLKWVGDAIRLTGHTQAVIKAEWFTHKKKYGTGEVAACGSSESLIGSNSSPTTSQFLITASLDKQLLVWDLNSPDKPTKSLAFQQPPTALRVSRDGSKVAVATYDSSLRILGLPDLQVMNVFFDSIVIPHLSWSCDNRCVGYNVYNGGKTIVVDTEDREN